jgi:succinylarginine dihydrolase
MPPTPTPPAREVNFDALVGPTHSYAGLSPGNIASLTHSGNLSSPRHAALEGIAKMRRCLDLGLTQGLLPPQVRPDVATLQRCGFAPTGTPAQVIGAAADRAPRLLAIASAASAMWTANAATVSPSADTGDGKVHITPANLAAHFHRFLEAPTTTRTLRAIFRDARHFVVHDPLPAHPIFGDEGAANHGRIAGTHSGSGVELFVFGRYALRESWPVGEGVEAPAPKHHIARQTFEASRALASTHALDPARTVFAQQHPDAIDAGVFHNDVISVTNGPAFLYHEHAFLDTPGVIERLRESARGIGVDLIPIPVRAADVSYADAVGSYLFNSQLLTLPDGSMMVLAPTESRDNPRVRAALDRIVADPGNPIARVEYVDLRQSMHNGGGPACLRLRVVLTDAQLAALPAGVIMTHEALSRLEDLVRRRYRASLSPGEIADPRLYDECLGVVRELEPILGIDLTSDALV